ncbi:hypothetical protein Smp_133930 [Schistosoma mansoni]|uniref:hypothetical protein n=1 Tax=Schistosoma mansoni TaxID=6183 RepID=UPI00022C82DD|nr:hypothetical protein Smp_133930 [Schistosoma mansoni]|eukprot:XP_018644158.1 hypothetical protein Smp_133930 [Schistosoma mansoni]
MWFADSWLIHAYVRGSPAADLNHVEAILNTVISVFSMDCGAYAGMSLNVHLNCVQEKYEHYQRFKLITVTAGLDAKNTCGSILLHKKYHQSQTPQKLWRIIGQQNLFLR